MDNFWVYFFSYLLVAVEFGYIARNINTNKGRSSREGFLYGFLLNFIGIIIVALLPTKRGAITPETIAAGITRECPYCAQIISAEEVVCRFCGREQPRKSITASNALGEPLEAQQLEKKPLSLFNKVVICAVGFGVGALMIELTSLLAYGLLTSIRSLPRAVLELTLQYGLLGLFGGLAIGLIKRQSIWKWVLAGGIGGIVGGLLYFVVNYEVLKGQQFFLRVFMSSLGSALSLGIAFTLVSKKWEHLAWIFLAGIFAFVLRRFIYLIDFPFTTDNVRLMLLLIEILGGMIVGLCYGLAFGLLDHFELKRSLIQ